MRLRPRPSPEPPEAVDDLVAQLHELRAGLAALTRGCAAAPDCLVQLRRYLLTELVPVLHGLQLRLHPYLRQVAGTFGRRSAAEHARLLRLTERVVALDTAATSAAADPAELAALTAELADLVDRHLSRELRTLPALLRRLPPTQADRLVAAAARTATTVRLAPHFDLDPALL